MDAVVAWFDATAPEGTRPLPALARAGVAHLYFESVHRFEDGNGRVGRALAEKSLAQNLGQPSRIAPAYTIEPVGGWAKSDIRGQACRGFPHFANAQCGLRATC